MIYTRRFEKVVIILVKVEGEVGDLRPLLTHLYYFLFDIYYYFVKFAADKYVYFLVVDLLSLV